MTRYFNIRILTYFCRIIALFFTIACYLVIPLFAESKWWDISEVSTLSVINDLQHEGANIWYVDGENGSDETGDGKTIETAWKTVSKAVNHYTSPVKPGDVIAIASGIYRERISIRLSGQEDRRIFIGPYGNGEVIIDGSHQITDWEVYEGNMYVADCDFTPTAVVVDEVPYLPEWNSVNDITTSGRWYYDPDAHKIYLWVIGGYNPNQRDVVVITSQSEDAVKVQAADYITIYGITVRGAGGHGISILGNNCRVEKCNVKFNGKAGINIFRYGDTSSTDVYIVKNCVCYNCLVNWPRGRFKWGGWPMGLVSNSTPNAHFIGNISYKNGGEGIGAYGGSGGTVIKDNMVYDNWSVNIYVDNQPNVLVEGNFVFSHEPDPIDLYNNQDPTPEDNRCLRRLRPEGIMTADENYNLDPPANFRNAKIVNNIILNCRRGITHYAQAEGSGLKDILVANNTIVVPDADPNLVGDNWSGISVPYNNGNNENAVYCNNIVYASNPNTYVFYGGTDPQEEKEPFYELSFHHNIWYHSGRVDSFHFGPSYNSAYNYTFEEWKDLGNGNQGIGSSFVDPLLFDVSSLSKEGVLLQENSPAIDIGTSDVSVVVKVDFDGIARPQGSGYDIGAYEYVSGSYTNEDVNQDGSVDINDVQLVVNVILGNAENSRADVNGDGSVTISDAQEVVNSIIG